MKKISLGRIPHPVVLPSLGEVILTLKRSEEQLKKENQELKSLHQKPRRL